MVKPTLSVIVRFHDLARLFELRRCLFSLVCQNYSNIEICLVTQRFNASDLQVLHDAVYSFLLLNESVAFATYNYSESTPQDARSALLNFGINRACGRYIAILDHDDTILPFGYGYLIDELERSSATIAFASVAYKMIDVFQDALIVNRRVEAFKGNKLTDLFEHNFCPIHSFVIDRSMVDLADLYFDVTLTKHEDYEFLLRICATYLSSFALVGKFVGDYYLKNDGSNTNTWLSDGSATWQESSDSLQQRKSEIYLSSVVKQQLGITVETGPISIKSLLENHVIMGKYDHS